MSEGNDEDQISGQTFSFMARLVLLLMLLEFGHDQVRQVTRATLTKTIKNRLVTLVDFLKTNSE